MKAKKILVRAPNWVGDVVMATPSFRCIRENFKDSHITLLIRQNLRGIINDSPWFDELIELKPVKKKSTDRYSLPFVNYMRGIRNFLSLVYQLRQKRFSLGIIFPNSFSSALITWLSGIGRRVGYKRDSRSFLLTDGLERPTDNGKFRPIYMADYYLRLCAHIGCEIKSREPELFIGKTSEKRVNQLFRKYHFGEKPYILINPGASFGSSKCWYAKEFARTADLLKEKIGCEIVLVCGPGETGLTDGIEKFSEKGLINLSQDFVSLEVLKALVKKSMLLLTVDSGPRHFAVALKRPTVVLMGPTDPRYTETEHETGEVIREDVDCSPCHLKICPTDHRCMTRITPDDVVKACIQVLKNHCAEVKRC